MTRRVRWYLALEAAAFFAAASVHSGVLLQGHEHSKAATAESVIGVVLCGALLVSVSSRRHTRAVGLWAQSFALLGTFVGLFTISIGIGPRTGPDVLFHAGIIAVLLAGIVQLARRPAAPRRATT